MLSMIQQNPFGSIMNGGMNNMSVGLFVQSAPPISMMQGMNSLISPMSGMGIPGAFGLDGTSFSSEAFTGGKSSFLPPMLANGMGTPPVGMNGGMGMVPGMTGARMDGMQDQQMMMMMMMIMMMLMQLMQRMGANGAMGSQQGMPGMPGGFGMPIGMNPGGMAGGVPGGFGMPIGMTAPGNAGFTAPSGYMNPGSPFGSPVGMVQGASTDAMGGVLPIDKGNYVVSSTFGPRGAVPGLAAGFHNGIDLAAPTGTPIKAAQTGTITRVSGNDGTGYGNWVEITHDNGSRSRYAHMSAFGNVRQGQRVAAGQVIGFVGSTGNSTGPHLHFETIDPKGRNVDPRTQRVF